ncbi:uncharacterized protein METZ01_LOCUS411096 [marine metagenome]|uniref:Cell division protein ZapA n=1 Tax=marine metagenome TaxID=408172 RepID=A0A382WHJ2_9ZZZZ
MPILKTEILGSQIEINYEASERDKLQRLISNFKHRLNEFPNKDGRISNNTILFLAALKVEDQLEEIKSLVDKHKEYNNKTIKQKKIIERMSKEIVFLKDKVNELNTFNLSKESRNSHVMEEITKLENMLQIIQKKILSKNNDGY